MSARCAAVVCAGLAAACVGPPAPPSGAQIVCGSDAECPGGTRCQRSTSRCVDAAAFDPVAPALKGAPSLAPAAGGTSTTFALAFDVTKKLAEDPVVVVDAGNGQTGAFVLDDAGTDRAKLHYEYRYTPSGLEVAARPSPVTIRLLDVAHNPSGDLAGGVITFDFTGPSFQGAPAVSPSLLGPGSVLSVSFTASEQLAADGGAVVDLVQGDQRLPLTDAGDHFTYTVDGSEPDGAWDVLVTLTDASGNTSPDLRAGSVVVDNTPPAAQGADVRRADGQTSREHALPDANHDTTLVVTFAATEPLAASPAVRAVCGDTSADLVRTGDLTSAVVFVFELRPPLSLSAGDCDVVADLVDLAGNSVSGAVVASPGFTYDDDAPAAPDVDTPGAVLYRRVPWGDDATQGAKQFTVAGIDGAVEPFARLSVYQSAGDAAGEAIAHVDAGDGGAFELTLPPVDRAEIFVSATDSAGNESARVRVRDVEWTATMGGKVAGSGFENPHRYESRSLFSDALAQGSVVEDAAEAARAGDGESVLTRGASTWTDVTATSAEPDFDDAGLTFDPVHGEVVAFGGASCRCGVPDLAACAETWLRKNEVWHVIAAPADPEGDGNPERRSRTSLTFDAASATSVLFGGAGSFGALGDTWEWNGASWRNVCTGACAASAPPARNGHAAAYDPVRRRLVVFGGRGAGGLLGDTWEWDGARWSQACTDAACAASAPAPRTGQRMAYDPVSHRVLLFGGDDVGDGASEDLLNDLWAWNGSAWTQLCTDDACAQTAPPPRTTAGVAFDPRAGKLVVFGGLGQDPPPVTCAQDPNNGSPRHLLGDTWTFDGTAWTDASPAAGPTPRRGTQAVDDPHGGRVVLVSGVDDDLCFAIECTQNAAADTWEWDGAAWHGVTTSLANANPRPAVQGGATTFPALAAYDAGDHEVVLVLADGEIDGWNGRWRPFGTNAQGTADTTALTLPALAAEGTTAMLFGGTPTGGSAPGTTNLVRINTTDTFFPTCFSIFGGGCSSFVLPPARSAGAMAKDALGRTVLFGGVDGSGNPLADTWAFNGSVWAQANVSGPGARGRASMAFDDDRGQTVLFGGQGIDRGPDPDDDTWEWDGTGWTPKSPATIPPKRRGGALWYDAARRRTILFGGDGSGFFGTNCGNGIFACSDTWEWDGSDWRKPAIADVDDDGEPGPRFDPAVAFHDDRRVAVLFGGNDNDHVGRGDTWLYDGGGDRRPGQVMFTVFAAAGTDGSETIDDVEARFVAGGTGDADAAGARLWVWDVDGWHALADNAAPSSTPDAVRWDGAETPLDGGAAALPALFFGPQRQLVFAVTPVERNGGRAGFGEVAADAAEVTVRYRLPAP